MPKNKEDLRKELQLLWDKVDPRDFRRYIERLTCKIEDIIEYRGMATIN